jgi:hypothetical protein
MQLSRIFEYPEHLEEKFDKAKKFEWTKYGIKIILNENV